MVRPHEYRDIDGFAKRNDDFAVRLANPSEFMIGAANYGRIDFISAGPKLLHRAMSIQDANVIASGNVNPRCQRYCVGQCQSKMPTLLRRAMSIQDANVIASGNVNPRCQRYCIGQCQSKMPTLLRRAMSIQDANVIASGNVNSRRQRYCIGQCQFKTLWLADIAMPTKRFVKQCTKRALLDEEGA